jgi:hypothetical protein
VASSRDYFTLGSTKDEVLAIQGTPNEVNDRFWKYGYSRIDFRNDRVVSWDISPSGSPLKARMLPATPVASSRDYFTLGSTKDEVLAIQGTPNEINDRFWKYGYSRIDFRDDRVVSWDISPSGSPLKVRAKGQ